MANNNTPSDNLSIQNMPHEERPRERLWSLGPQALSNAELLAIILRTGTQQENALHLAERILATCQNLTELAQTPIAELANIHGLGTAKVAQIAAALELGKRLMRSTTEARPTIRTAEDAAQLVMDMGSLPQETVRVILLDTAKRVVAIPTIYMGTINASVVRTAEIFREAIIRNCPALILVHNHPAGDPSPSPEDLKLTRILASAGHLLDIQVIDHLIIGHNRWVSIKDMGLDFG